MKLTKAVLMILLLSGALFPQQLFVDEFNSLDNWVLFGDPKPRWIESIYGMSGIFDNNGDPNYNSGAISKKRYRLSQGFKLESTVFLDYQNKNGCWAGASIGLSDGITKPWGGYDPVIYISIEANGEACWASKSSTRKRAICTGGYKTSDGWENFGDVGGNNPVPKYIDDYANSWQKIRIIVDSDMIPKFFVSSLLIYQGTKPISSQVLNNECHIWLGSRSSGSAGKAYHNRISLEIPDLKTEGKQTNSAIIVTVDGLDFYKLLGQKFVKTEWIPKLEPLKCSFEEWDNYLGKALKMLELENPYTLDIQPFPWERSSYYTDMYVQNLYDHLKKYSENARQEKKKFIVVAHSWGTVLAYAAMAKNFYNETNPIECDLFITLACPLGSKNQNPPLHISYGMDEIDLVNIYVNAWLDNLGIRNSEKIFPNTKKWINFWNYGDVISGPLKKQFPSVTDIEMYPESKLVPKVHLVRSVLSTQMWHKYNSLQPDGELDNLNLRNKVFELIKRTTGILSQTMTDSEYDKYVADNDMADQLPDENSRDENPSISNPVVKITNVIGSTVRAALNGLSKITVGKTCAIYTAAGNMIASGYVTAISKNACTIELQQFYGTAKISDTDIIKFK
ncbi:MAG: hypothetical protein ACM3RX_07510 [Methanococcaceae archaeon]